MENISSVVWTKSDGSAKQKSKVLIIIITLEAIEENGCPLTFVSSKSYFETIN